MRILGIDPGTALLGYGVVDVNDQPELVAYGVVETQPNLQMPLRLLDLHSGTSNLIERYQPHVLAVEQLFFVKNVTTGIAVGQARGVVLLAAAQHGLLVHEYAPTEVKQAIVGYGRAEKSQMQEMVRILLSLDEVPKPDDAADALAIAICHAQRMRFDALVANR